MRLSIGLSILLASAPAPADEFTYTCRAPSNVDAITERHACKGFIAHDASGKEVQRVEKGYFLSGSILATPNGSTVAMLQDYPTHGGTRFGEVDALIFFRGGKVIAKYTMTDLVQRMKLVTASAMHTHWIPLDAHPELVLGKTLELTTTSRRTYTFDVATGVQTSADDTEDWKKCDLIVYATEHVPDPVNGVYTIAKPWFAKGTASATLVLRADPEVRIRSGESACAMKTQHGWKATKNIGVMFNLLPN